MIETIQPPAFSGLVREVLCLIELPRLLLQFPSLLAQPRGKREPVLIFPPHSSGDVSTTLLKAYLRLIGYRARGWGLGRNKGDVTELLAREHPDLICRVITLGTPVIGGPKYTALSEIYRKRGMDIEAIAAEVDFRNQAAPLETPVVAIYSRIDAPVAWQACIDHQTLNVEHVEVRSAHYGFGFSPEVYRIIAQRLAQADDRSRHESGEKPHRRKHIRLRTR